MIKRKFSIFLGILVFCIIFSSFFGSVKANYSSKDLKVDGKFDKKYTLFKERENFTLYSANTEYNFYFYVNFTENIENKSILFHSENLIFNLSNSIDTEYLKSTHINNSLEFSISSEIIENKQFSLEIEHEFKSEQFVLPIYSRESLGLFSTWGVAAIIILIIVGFLICFVFMKANDQIILKGFKTEELKLEDQKSESTNKIQAGTKKYGLIVDEKFDEKKRCYKIFFKHNNQHYHAFSNYTKDTYLHQHLHDKNYKIVYSINTLMYSKPLPKDKYYDEELGWTTPAIFYRAFSWCFNLKQGILVSWLICGMILAIAFPDKSYAFLIGLPVGFIISAINTLLQVRGKAEKLLKKQVITVKKDYFIMPLESSEERVPIYRVKGTYKKEVLLEDGAKELREFILQDNENVEYQTVRGYEEYYRLLNDPQVKIQKKETQLYDIEFRKRSNQEMLNLPYSYMLRNQQFAEEIFTLKEELQKAHEEIKDYQNKLLIKDSENLKKLKDFGISFEKQIEEKGLTLKDIFIELDSADFVEMEWQDKLVRANEIIEKRKHINITKRLNEMLRLLENIVKILSQTPNLNMDQLIRYINKMKMEEGNNHGISKSAETTG